jgi:hypothetical protein
MLSQNASGFTIMLHIKLFIKDSPSLSWNMQRKAESVMPQAAKLERKGSV